MQEGRGQNENIMADKTPVRVVFNASNVATGLAEFQTGDTVPVASGGTGLSSIGSAGQVLKVNAAGNALEFGAEGDLSITNLVAPTNADLTLSTSGTGNIVLDQITLRGTTFSSTDSSAININEGLIVDGTLNVSGATVLAGLTFPTSDGSTGQVLQTNGSGTLSFASVSLGDLSIVGSSIASPSNADLTLDPAGSGAIKLNANTDITGSATITTTTTDDSLLLTTTEDSNSAAPVLTLKRNSSSPADADYLGRIKFKGENDADQEVQYGSISGKILDASDGTEDGAIEFNIKKAGSNNIAMRLNSDELKLLNSTSLDVEGAGTFAGVVTATSVTTNDIVSNGSNADINLTPAGTGKVTVTGDATVGDDLELISDAAILKFGADGEIAITHVHNTGILITDSGGTPTIQLHDSNESISSDGSNLILTSGGTAYKMPTTDGSAGEVLKTDGSGGLSFGSTAATPSDDTRVVIKNNKSVGSSARTIDYFQTSSADLAWYFVALNDISNDHSSASCFAVCHNNTDAFIGGPRGGASGSDNTLPTTSADVSSSQVRVKVTAPSSDAKLSYYKIPLSTSNTSDETAGVTVTTSNTDVDSATESIDSFAHASFRAAKYLILVDNNSKTETGVVEALVVHNGSDAFIAQYGDVNTGSNNMIVLSAAIDGSNVVVSAAGNEPNLSLKIHKTLLSDSMTAVSNGNQKIIGATTVSSSATAFDDFDLDDATAAVYYVVGKNASEGAYSVQEVYCAGAPGEASVSQGPFVSTKASTQLNFTAAFKSDADNSLELSVASTSGGSTIVNAYRINCLAE